MKIIFAFLIIIFLSFSGYHLTFRGFKLPLFARQFYLTGTEFLFLGLLLGPQFLNLFDETTRKGLAPLSALVLGWIGLLYGFQFEIVKLRRFPIEYLKAAKFEAVFTLLIVFFAAYAAIVLFFQIPDSMIFPISLTLAATAACTTQTGIALIGREAAFQRRNTLKLLKYISSIDGLGAILIFGMAFILRDASFDEISWFYNMLWGILISLSASLGLLFLFTVILKKRLIETELILIVIGMIILTSGMASSLQISPLLTNFFVGLWLVNMSRDKERIYNILITTEKPAYILLLVFLGSEWYIDSGWIFLGAGAYWLWRSSGKIISGFIITRFITVLKAHPPHLGFGLLEQGGLPLAMLLDFRQGFPCEITIQLMSLVLVAVVYNDVLSPHFLKKLLQKSHE
ncbi:Cation/H+ exchanger domain-containing protein [Candidatus Magnetomoraceae bacterium gMMP-1]